MKTSWLRVTRREPCPVCGKTSYCTRSADGTAVHCMKIESANPVMSKGEVYGWLHKLDQPLPARPAAEPVEKKPDWTAECKAMYAHRQAAQKRAEVAQQLGVPVDALELLRVGIGWDEIGREFSSWPSRDQTGKCIGFVRRYPGKKKLTNLGGSTGVFYTANWYKHPGPILIVEGGSDVAACESVGVGAIGRASNVCGSAFIRPMLLKKAVGRQVVVIGERDEEPGKRGRLSQCPLTCKGCAHCWPGLYGMLKVARELNCGAAMCPSPLKDMREVVRAGAVGEFLERLRRDLQPH